MFARAFAAAVAELEETLGNDPADWTWGDLHTLSLAHDVMSNFPGISALFNPDPYRASGGSSIVNATGWSASDDTPYAVRSVPSMRMIVDLGSLQDSQTIHLTGQSGHAGHAHYTDMTGLWAMIEYHTMHWERAAVEAAAEGHLILMP
jgi:penicillin amidase